jgi:hypothetical protein
MRRIPNWTCQLEPNSSATSTAERHRLRPFFVIAFCVLQRGHPNNGTTEDILQTATVELQKKLNLPRILPQDGKGQEEQGGNLSCCTVPNAGDCAALYIFFVRLY